MQFNFYYRATATSHCSGLHILTHSPLQRRFRSSGLQHYSCTALWALDYGPLQSLRSFLSPLCSGSLSCSWPSLGRALAVGSWRLSDCKGMKPSLLHHHANRWYNVFVLTWRVWFYPHMLHMMNKHLSFVPEALQTWSLLPSSFWRDVFSSKQATLVQSSSNCSVMNFDL